MLSKIPPFRSPTLAICLLPILPALYLPPFSPAYQDSLYQALNPSLQTHLLFQPCVYMYVHVFMHVHTQSAVWPVWLKCSVCLHIGSSRLLWC